MVEKYSLAQHHRWHLGRTSFCHKEETGSKATLKLAAFEMLDLIDNAT